MTDTNVSEWLEAVGAANDGADGAEPAQAAEPEANVSTQPHAEAQANPIHPSLPKTQDTSGGHEPASQPATPATPANKPTTPANKPASHAATQPAIKPSSHQANQPFNQPSIHPSIQPASQAPDRIDSLETAIVGIQSSINFMMGKLFPCFAEPDPPLQFQAPIPGAQIDRAAQLNITSAGGSPILRMGQTATATNSATASAYAYANPHGHAYADAKTPAKYADRFMGPSAMPGILLAPGLANGRIPTVPRPSMLPDIIGCRFTDMEIYSSL